MLLDLLEDYIRLRGYTYERLDGGVTGERRQNAIDRFSARGSETFLFLLGTRAGGVGINLVAADTVIIFDPDWNPQNDIQAQARCHRIGQEKLVRVYRLLTRETYEYSLYERANQKLGLEQAIIGHGEYAGGTEAGGSSRGAGKLQAAEIEGLLKHGAQRLFTEEHDSRIEQFSEASIDAILERCAVTTTAGSGGLAADPAAAGGKSLFATATFKALDGETTLDMHADDFWTQAWAERVWRERV